MQDLNENETNEETNEEINEEVKEEVNQETNQEEVKEPLEVLESKEIKQIKQISKSKRIVNKNYKISELIALSFNVTKGNMDIIVNALIKTVTVMIIAIIATFGISALYVVMIATGSVSTFNKNGLPFLQLIAILFEIMSVGFMAISTTVVLVFFIYVVVKSLLMNASVVRINTGIQQIELKKSKASNRLAYFKMLVIYCIFGVILIPLSLIVVRFFSVILLINESLSTLGDYAVPVLSDYSLSRLPIVILSVLLVLIINKYIIFCCFEVFAKGKGIVDAILNATKNLFCSKNNIIIKSLAGDLLIGVLIVITILFILVFSVIFKASFSGSVGIFISMNIYGVGFFILWCVGFFGTIYSYLTYMLNKVR